jgi:pimeloyl-ACP methyl ester carboxylesterase
MLEAVLASRKLPGAGNSWNSLRDRFLKEKQGTYHLRPELRNLRTPTLFIWGDKDSFAPPEFGEQMAKMAPRARCDVVRDAGHHVWVDQPKHAARLTMEFLKGR